MKEKLIIRNFGPIKDVELEFGKFNILIGEQATGKSTVAKMLAVCRYFSYIMDNGPSGLVDHFENGLELWGLSEFIKEDTFVSYCCEHYTFIAARQFRQERNPETDEPDGGYHYFSTRLEQQSNSFKNLMKEFEFIKPTEIRGYGFHEMNWKPPTSFFENDVANVLDNPFYLPTERGLQSIFSLGKSSIQNLSDSLFNQFARMDQIARLFKRDTQIEPLNITYKNVEGKGFIKKDKENQFYSLYNAASGYQSTIPVVLLFKYYSEFRKKKKTFIIEEPEQNLFPSAQYRLVRFLSENLENSNNVLITTHSPYILTSLNNLMEAYQVGQSNSEETNKTISSNYWVNPHDVTSYQLLTDGTCEDIFDREEGLIKAEKIDGVSRLLNMQFDQLSDIGLNVN